MSHETLDPRDTATLASRQDAFDQHDGPRVGDIVMFADATERRISSIWNNEYQTSNVNGGSWYLGNGYMDFSGSLHRAVPGNTVTDTGATSPASAWFFHHDQWRAHNGVDVTVTVRVFRCNLPATR